MKRVLGRTCVIIDAYSTGALIAPAVFAHGVASLHVRTMERPSAAQRAAHRPSDFVEEIVFDGDSRALAARLRRDYPQVAFVVPGIESAVELADELSEYLGLPGNGTRMSRARRDKALMARVVASHGLRVISHIATRSADEALAWARRHGFERLIIKPLASSGTYGFHICKTEHCFREAFAALLDSLDIFGERVEQVLVQPCIEGREFAVNFVSFDGRHRLSEIWETSKRTEGQSKVYDKERLRDPHDVECGAIIDYVKKVLDALEIVIGPSHTEVILAEDGYVYLIESAARLMGALDVSLVSACHGDNAVLMAAEAYAAPEVFRARSLTPTVLRGHAAMVQLIATRSGVMQGFDMDELHSVPSFYAADLYVLPGDPVLTTINSYTSPGLVFLQSDDESAVESGYRRIRELEDAGCLYSMRTDGQGGDLDSQGNN